jgi:signal transduction histidine kinase
LKVLENNILSYFSDYKQGEETLSDLQRRQVLRSHRIQLRNRRGAVRHILMDANGLWEARRFIHSRWFIRDVTRRVELEREVMDAAERERHLLGNEMHDGLCQQLTGIEFFTQSLMSELGDQPRGDMVERVERISGLVRDAIGMASEMAHNLSSVPLETLGLAGALQDLANRAQKLYKFKCRLICNELGLSGNDALSIHLYRIAQEALAGAARSAGVKHVEVEIIQSTRRVRLMVRDDGTGTLKRYRKRQEAWLRVMAHRSSVIGGTLTIRRRRSGGSILTCIVGSAGRNH